MKRPDRLASLLGLAARAGALEFGTDLVRRAARSDRLHLVVIASDISSNTRQKLEPLLAARSIRWIGGPDRDRLGSAVGRGALSAVGVRDARFAREIADGADEAGTTQS